MQDIALYGAGGFGREVACMLKKINNINGPTWNMLGFFDDGKEKGYKVSHFGHILGGLEELNNWKGHISVALCFGDPKTLKNVQSNISNPNISFPNIIDPTFEIEDMETFSIGVGNIIKRNSSVTTSVSIGNYNVLNGSIRIGHDATIGDFNVIMPGVRISGEVKIGNQNLLGAESFIKQRIHVGDRVTLSPLSALLTKPKDNHTYIGNPAKKFVL